MPKRGDIDQATAVLVGKALWRCTRATNMAMFEFGERRQTVTWKGEPHEVGEWALHVQCAWRITRADRVIVGSRDIHYPAEYSEGQEVPEDFDWDRDATRLDKQVGILFENGSKAYVVQSVDVGLAGSLHIVLADSLFLDVFPDNSLTLEHWRLFASRTDGPHFVVTGQGP